MKKLLKNLAMIVLSVCVSIPSVFSQGRPYRGPDDPAGDIAAIRAGYMNGNRILLYFQNTTELSHWPEVNMSKWPNNYKGVRMLDGVALLVGARVFIRKTDAAVDTIPVTDPVKIRFYGAQKQLDTLYYLQTQYREEMDTDPTGTLKWGFYPPFGYFNETSEYPAMSNLPESWPPQGWPAQGRTLKWPGEWDGRFGRGVIYADLETYFVVNDAQDQENLGPEDLTKYYPRPGVKIGDLRPDVTIQKGKPWGGIGVRVQTRGFQWNNPQARDALFWEYTIANISDYDLPDVAFGYWVDNGIGGADGDDDLGFFDTKLDMAYSWDINGVGIGGLPTGTMGFAYLESPGSPYDGVDNDQDGLIDEKRDNAATKKIGPEEGIADLQSFLDFYHLKKSDLHEHWDADEDQDWEDGNDRNGDGIYESNEDAGDDVGLDGVGPTELNYKGPDQGECNHMPDFVEGVGCEPDFDETDVSETDMIGLTSFMMFPVQPHAPPYTKWFRNDKSMWEVIGEDHLVEYTGKISNLIETFATGPFPLHQGLTERISMSELHSYDPLEGLNSDNHSAPALYREKKIVQVIYEKDYRFAQPPKMPTLQATAGDGEVILTWDNTADTKTRDPFLGNVNDFEGYKLFKATDKKMSDAEVITDGYGTPMFKKPIFQCDKVDGKSGFTNFGMVNGMGYNLGNETGIVHHFIDHNVENGRTYYYAIVAYDSGASMIGPGIGPSENKIIIDLDEEENVRAVGPNVQIVTPHQMAAGYVPPSVSLSDSTQTVGTAKLSPEILAKNSLKTGHTYKVKFGVDTIRTIPYYKHGIWYTNNGFRIYDETGGNKLVYEESPEHYAYDNLVYHDTLGGFWSLKTGKELSTDIFDGMLLRLDGTVETAGFDAEKSGWLVGDAPISIVPTVEESKYLPWDYDIVFTDQDSAYVGRVKSRSIHDETGRRIPRNEILLNQAFNFYVLNRTFKDSLGNYEVMDLIGQDMNADGKFNLLDDRVLVGPVNEKGGWAGTAFIIDLRGALDSKNLPKPNDVYRVTFKRPFLERDSVLFSVKASGELDAAALKTTMDKIKVVPNPYVATNAMEPAVSNYFLNQRRRLLFTHLPARCTIKIFTMSGVLVREIDVNNPDDDGIAHWDLRSREGLEVAAGMYIYHVKAKATGDEKMGKFAIIK